MALNTNLTSTAGIASLMPAEWYHRKLLEVMKGILIYDNFAQKRSMPAHNGKTVQFRKWTPWGANITPLTEGEVPNGLELAQTDLTATIDQYGDFTTVSDMLDLTALDPVANDAMGLLGMRAAETIDALNIKEMKNASNVVYASTAAAVTDITAAMKLTSLELRKAVRDLKKRKAKPFMRNGRPFYYAIVTPDSTFDLQSDANWLAVAQYQAGEKIENGEIGKLFGVVIIEASNPVKWAGGGAGTPAADVYGTPVFGQNFYGNVSIDGKDNTQIYVKPAGSAGTADPLNQFSTIGYKIMAYCVKILDQSAGVMIKHGVSA